MTKQGLYQELQMETVEHKDAIMKRVKELLEELLAMPFVVKENGLGPEERDLAEGGIWLELIELTGARDTCSLCGEMYRRGDGHICF